MRSNDEEAAGLWAQIKGFEFLQKTPQPSEPLALINVFNSNTE